MFSATFRLNGAQIKIRKGTCARDHDMRSLQSCPPDLVHDRGAVGELGVGRSLVSGEGSAGIIAAASAGDEAEPDWSG
jgi:hypothetical protein